LRFILESPEIREGPFTSNVPVLLNDDFPRHAAGPKRRRAGEAQGQDDDEPNQAGHQAAAWIDGHRVGGQVTKVTSI